MLNNEEIYQIKLILFDVLMILLNEENKKQDISDEEFRFLVLLSSRS